MSKQDPYAFVAASPTLSAALSAPLTALSNAACVDANPDLFDGDRVTPRHFARAATYCDACPVARQCLSGALTRRESGVWGGRLLHHGEDVTSVLADRAPAEVA